MWSEIAFTTGMTVFLIYSAQWSRRSVTKLGQTISTVTSTVFWLMAVEWLFCTVYLLTMPAPLRQSSEVRLTLRAVVVPLIGPIPLGFVAVFYWLYRLWQKPVQTNQ